jgi:hypothetical protein
VAGANILPTLQQTDIFDYISKLRIYTCIVVSQEHVVLEKEHVQAFLTTYLIDSGYKTPIQNMDELFASGIKLAYIPDFSYIFETGEKLKY